MPKKTAVLIVVCLCLLPFRALGGGDLAKKGKARLEAAEKAYKAWIDPEDGPSGPYWDILYGLSVRWLNAELDLATKKEERITAYKNHLKRMENWEQVWRKVEKASKGSTNSNNEGIAKVMTVIELAHREAEYWLEKERSTKK